MTAGVEERDARGSDEGAPSPAVANGSVRSSRALVLPVSLAMGWGVLLGYSTVLLTDDPPARPEIDTIQTAFNEPGPFEDRAGGARSPRGSAPWSDVGVGSGPSGRDAVVAPTVQPGIRSAALRQDPEMAPRADAVTAASPPVEPAAYVGLWGPNESACGRGARRRGYIPARITESGARAGNTVCTFRDGRRIGANWSVSASCSDGGRRWSSQVKLLVDGNRLTWSSAKGDASYVRCRRRAG
ncbi:hypothetical protein [Methylobacterium sp. Leaf93]|uniref:hypothetical protein n=1 Tax=Methylobacterium sp. Leaf93 TaxID=1736249 RepID=UPI0006FC41C6|nr:hypothetical protein [Methylobacterium sp. Leaf93]KQP03312.1 hypothetical protein ASF26_13470 [Methylobacterium sp. Leaf93]